MKFAFGNKVHVKEGKLESRVYWDTSYDSIVVYSAAYTTLHKTGLSGSRFFKAITKKCLYNFAPLKPHVLRE